jgi:predicted ArsR family transcriptional regulator
MVEEKEIVAFLEKRGGEASINDIAEGLGIPKYGPNSAYAFLQSLKNKGIVERRGELWTLTEEARLKSVEKPQVVERTLAKPAEEAGISLQKPEQKTETVISGDVENLVRAMAQALADAMRSVKMPADEWELATRPMTTRIEKEGEEKLGILIMGRPH